MARGDDQRSEASDLGVGEVAAALLSSTEERILYLARDEVRAAAVARAAAEGAGKRVVLHLPASDALPGDDAPASPGIAGQRTAALRHCREAVESGQSLILVSSGEAAGRLLPRPEAFSSRPPVLKVGDRIDLEAFRSKALDVGYVEDDRVDEPGEVAVRGSVVDLYPGDQLMPVRLEIEDGVISAIRTYDPLSQLTQSECDVIEVGTVSEPEARGGVTLLDHLPGAALALDEGAERRRKRFLALAADAAKRLPARALADICSDEAWREARGAASIVDLASGFGEPPPRFIERRSPEREFVRFARKVLEEGRTLLLLGSARDLRFLGLRGERALKRPIETIGSFAEAIAAPAGSLLALPMAVPRGFALGEMVAVAAADLIGSRAEQEAGTTISAVQAFAAPDIRLGDVVVHEDHGLGVVAGLTALPEEGGDAVLLRFAGDNRRLVPIAEAGRLWRYGSEEEAVTLDKLDGSSWEKRRGEVLAAVAQTARGLVALADERQKVEAPALEPDPTRYEQLAGSFPHSETADQLKAIEAIRSDLASGKPMDRLVIGDVGFGKTEVALRAAAMAVFAGRQVALAAPTTVLARQHLETFRNRFAELGVEVAMLSRLVTGAAKKKVLDGLASGAIHVVVGTGAIAGKGVTYQDLGLVIIDEEQRFGAKDKDKLRSLGAPHALSLTATPIPRTLQSALVGLQPMSVLATPPARRQPIRTEVGSFDLERLRTALLRERSRGGQSFVVVPRIEDMEPLAERLKTLVPELAVAQAHGKLPAAEIDEAMVSFASGQGDVLLATNIIEAGLDVPRANTMVVVHAERFGLSQLHQLRGRVGRGARRGHILLMTSAEGEIAPKTLARLNTLAAFDRLGAGFAISARDLDLRGAGDLLGEEQSGHLKLIGIDLYQHLLGAALKEARGEAAEAPEPDLKLGTTGRFSEDWIPEEEVRLGLYLRLARLDSPGAIETFEAELSDRFGEPPTEAERLIASARIRLLAKAAGIARIDAGPAAVAFTPRDRRASAPAALQEKDGRWLLRFAGEEGEDQLSAIETILADLAGD